jgi:hypothetical protein
LSFIRDTRHQAMDEADVCLLPLDAEKGRAQDLNIFSLAVKGKGVGGS